MSLHFLGYNNPKEVYSMNDREPSIPEMLQAHPEIEEYIRSLFKIIEAKSGYIDTANEAELLILETSRLICNVSMHDWAKNKMELKINELLSSNCHIVPDVTKKLQWSTIHGVIEIEEKTFVVNGHLVRPFSYSAKVTHKCNSLLLQRRITDFGADHTFGKVKLKLKEHYGFTPPDHAARTITEKHAKNIRETESYKNTLPEFGAEIIVGETDGCTVPIVTIRPKLTDEDSPDGRKRRVLSGKEARLALAYTPEMVTPIFNATMEKEKGADKAGDQLLDCVIRSGGGKNSKVHCVGDGAKWITNQLSRVLPGQFVYTIDFMHFCEYLEPASKVCYPNDSPAWLAKHKAMMKEGNVLDVIKALEPHIELTTSDKPEPPVKSCHRYLSNRPGQFDYKSAIDADLPIGSGKIESGHRYVIQARLKIAGAWWLQTNADNMLALRVLRENGGWEDYWEEQYKKAA